MYVGCQTAAQAWRKNRIWKAPVPQSVDSHRVPNHDRVEAKATQSDGHVEKKRKQSIRGDVEKRKRHIIGDRNDD